MSHEFLKNKLEEGRKTKQREFDDENGMMMPLIGESLDFTFYFLNSSLRPH